MATPPAEQLRSAERRNPLYRFVPKRARDSFGALAARNATLARFGKDTFWSTFGNIVMQGLSFCSTLVITHLLTKQEFGQYTVFLSSVGLLGTLAGLGLGIAITTEAAALRNVAPDELGHRLSAAYWIGGVVTLALCAVLAIAWAVIGYDFLQLEMGPLYFLLLALTIASNTAAMLQAAELSGYQSFRSLALAQCARGFVRLPLCVMAAVLLGLPGVISAGAVATAIGIVAQQVMLSADRRKRGIIVPIRPRWRDLSNIFSCSVPAFITNVANVAGGWGANITVAASGPAGIEAVAEFGAASQLRNILLFLPNIVGQVLMPTIANRNSARSGGERRIAFLGVALGTAVAGLLAALVIFFKDDVALLFGSTYAQASGTVALVAISGVVYVSQSTINYVLIGYGQIRWVCICSIFGAVALVVVASALIFHNPGIGGRALGWASIVASAIQLAMVLADFMRVSAGARDFA